MAVEDEAQREAALITFLVSASGISLFGISAAFWGLVAGILSALVCSGNWPLLKQFKARALRR
jgi:benzoate membrane transport protein